MNKMLRCLLILTTFSVVSLKAVNNMTHEKKLNMAKRLGLNTAEDFDKWDAWRKEEGSGFSRDRLPARYYFMNDDEIKKQQDKDRQWTKQAGN